MKTLKYEEVLRNEYRDLAEARASLHRFLEKVYHQKCLHSAPDYVPPAEFEAQLAENGGRCAVSYGMSFQGMGKSIHAMGHDLSNRAALIAVDESPAGYSLAGCAPAEPASASPAALRMR